MEFNLTSTHSQLNARISWWYKEKNINGNYSVISAQLEISKNQSVPTSGHWYGSLTVGNKKEDFSTYVSLVDDWYPVCEINNVTIYHNDDGTGSAYISGNVKGPTGTSMSSASASGSKTVTLDQIPRDAQLLTAENFTDEGNPTITYENKAGKGMELFQAGIFDSSGSTAYVAYRNISRTDKTYTFNLTTAERNTLRNAIPNDKSMTVTFKLKYKLGNQTKYSTIQKSFSITNANPTLSPTIVDTDSTITALTGDSSKLVKYYSDAKITFGADAIKGASVSSKKCLNGSQTLNNDGTFTNVESNTFQFSVTDSRGFTVTQTLTPSFVEYVKLTNNFQPNLSLGGLLTLEVKGNYFNGSFGAVSNTLNVSYRYKKEGGSYSSWAAISPSYSSNTYTGTVTFQIPNFNYRDTYVFQTKANDKLASLTSEEYVVRALPVFDWGANDFNFNVPVVIMGSPVYTDTVLYDDYSGSSSTISLTDNARNYDYIEIYFSDENGYGGGYTKVYNPNYQRVYLSLTEGGSSGFYHRYCVWTIYDNSIILDPTSAGHSYIANNYWDGGNVNKIKIYRVVGYKGVGL